MFFSEPSKFEIEAKASATEESIPNPELRRFPIPPPTSRDKYDSKKRRFLDLNQDFMLKQLNPENVEEFNELTRFIDEYPVYLEGIRLIEKLQKKGIIFVNVHFHHNKNKDVVRRFACIFPYNETTLKDLKDCIEKNWNQYLLEGESTLNKKDQVLFRPHKLSRFDETYIDYRAHVVSLGIFSDESKNLVPLKNLCQQDDKDYAQIHGVDVFIVPQEEMEAYKSGEQEQPPDVLAQKKLEALKTQAAQEQEQKQEVDPKRQIELCQKLFNPLSERKKKVTSPMTEFMSLLNKLTIPYKEADKKQRTDIVVLSKLLSLADILYIVLMLWVGKLHKIRDLDLNLHSLFPLYMDLPPPIQTGGLRLHNVAVAGDSPLGYGGVVEIPKLVMQELEEIIKSIPNLKDNVKIDKTQKIVKLTFQFPTFFSSDSESILKFGTLIDQMMMMRTLKYEYSNGNRIPLEDILKIENMRLEMEETFQKAYLIYSLFHGASTEKMVNMMLYFQKDPSIFKLVMGGSRKKNNKKTKSAKKTKRTKRAKKTKRTKRAKKTKRT